MVPHDVTCENKRCALDMACLKRINTKLPKMAAKPKAGTTQIAGWSARCHTLPRIFWACPHDRSLQPLYLHYITMLCLVITNLHIYRNEDGVALPHHWLRVPPPPTPTHAPQQQSLMVTPAPVRSNVQGSSHQLWCLSPTTGHQK